MTLATFETEVRDAQGLLATTDKFFAPVPELMSEADEKAARTGLYTSSSRVGGPVPQETLLALLFRLGY